MYKQNVKSIVQMTFFHTLQTEVPTNAIFLMVTLTCFVNFQPIHLQIYNGFFQHSTKRQQLFLVFDLNCNIIQ